MNDEWYVSRKIALWVLVAMLTMFTMGLVFGMMVWALR